MPRTMIRLKSEIMLMVPPMAHKMTRAPAMDMGIPMPLQKESRAFKKHHSNKKTIVSPIMPFFTSRLIRDLSISVLS